MSKILEQIYVGPKPTGKSDPDLKNHSGSTTLSFSIFSYVCLNPDPLNPLNPVQAYPSKRTAVCNFFQKIMPITQPDPETEGQSINKASGTKKFQSQKGVKYSDFSMVENDKIYAMGALLKLSDKK
jgi:hypothetical protein